MTTTHVDIAFPESLDGLPQRFARCGNCHQDTHQVQAIQSEGLQTYPAICWFCVDCHHEIVVRR